MRKCCLIQRKNNSICHRDLYIWAMVSAGRVKLLVRNLNRFLVFTSRELTRRSVSGYTLAESIAERMTMWAERTPVLLSTGCEYRRCSNTFDLVRTTKKAELRVKTNSRWKSILSRTGFFGYRFDDLTPSSFMLLSLQIQQVAYLVLNEF